MIRVSHPVVSRDTRPVQLDASTTAYDVVAQIVQSAHSQTDGRYVRVTQRIFQICTAIKLECVKSQFTLQSENNVLL